MMVSSDKLDFIKVQNIETEELAIYQQLRESAFREDGSFIADSPKVVNLLLQSELEIKSILATQAYYDEFAPLLQGRNIPKFYLTTKEEMGKIVGHKIHHNCMMHGIRALNATLEKLGDGVLLLDGITSAENVGSVVRSCAALGVDSLVIANETPHPFNRRALRVSMGYAHLLRTHVHKDIKQSIVAFQERGYRVYAAEVAPNATMLSDVNVAQKWVLVMGHEGRGISQDILELCDEVLTIEMQEGIKSFNVGIAASIIMYKLMHS
jgi:tRNA G18 (ribose-2'-O)-methylase SpoU